MNADETAERDEDLDLAALDPFTPPEHQRLGGSGRALAWWMTLGGAVGAGASIELLVSEIHLVSDPQAQLGCDLNPLIGCSTSLLQWQSHLLFGLPNAAFGAALFGVLAGLGVALLAGARLASWLWQLMSVAMVGAVGFVLWFLYQSMTALGTLCPWCMVTWAVIIPAAFGIWAQTARGGHLPLPRAVVRTLYLERWLMGVILVVAILLAIVFGFWSKWLLVLGV